MILNTIFPHDFQYLNEFSPDNFTHMPEKFIIKKGTNIKEYVENLPLAKCYKKGDFGPIISDVFNKFKTVETSKMLDNLKDKNIKEEIMNAILRKKNQRELEQINYSFEFPISLAVLTHITRHRMHSLMVPKLMPLWNFNNYIILMCFLILKQWLFPLHMLFGDMEYKILKLVLFCFLKL